MVGPAAVRSVPCSSTIFAVAVGPLTVYRTSTSRGVKNDRSHENGCITSGLLRPASSAASEVACSSRASPISPAVVSYTLSSLVIRTGRAATSSAMLFITSGSDASPRPPTGRPATSTLRRTWPDNAAVSIAHATTRRTRANTGTAAEEPAPNAGPAVAIAGGRAEVAAWRLLLLDAGTAVAIRLVPGLGRQGTADAGVRAGGPVPRRQRPRRGPGSARQCDRDAGQPRRCRRTCRPPRRLRGPAGRRSAPPRLSSRPGRGGRRLSSRLGRVVVGCRVVGEGGSSVVESSGEGWSSVVESSGEGWSSVVESSLDVAVAGWRLGAGPSAVDSPPAYSPAARRDGWRVVVILAGGRLAGGRLRRRMAASSPSAGSTDDGARGGCAGAPVSRFLPWAPQRPPG